MLKWIIRRGIVVYMYVHIIEMILAEILWSKKKVRRTDIIILRNQIFCLYHHHSNHNWLRHLVSFCWCGDCWNVYETFMSSLHAGSICRIYYRGQDDNCNELFKCPSSTSQKVDPIDRLCCVSALIKSQSILLHHPSDSVIFKSWKFLKYQE